MRVQQSKIIVRRAGVRLLQESHRESAIMVQPASPALVYENMGVVNRAKTLISSHRFFPRTYM